MTLAAVYGPNEDKPCFFETLQSKKINIFPNSSLILVGDWNVVQDYNLDTINYRRENNSNSKLKLHSMMNDLDLINRQIDDRWINNLNARIGIRVIN
jgi:anionic cell wall polymer biosynthesis LytR-Cps2A-Psr (LCP) family protein